MKRICDYPQWDYFLDGKVPIGIQRAADSTIGVACTLDWLGDALTAEERERAEKDIAEKGAPACYLTLYGMKHPDRVRGWSMDPTDEYPFRYDLSRWPIILNSTNLKAIPTAGLGLAACVYGDVTPRRSVGSTSRGTAPGPLRSCSTRMAATTRGSVTRAMPRPISCFSPRHFGARRASTIARLVNYPGTIRTMLAMSMPTLGAPTAQAGERNLVVTNETINPAYDIVNFGDSGIGLDALTAPWVATTQNDPLAQYVATSVGTYKNHFGAIWLDPTLPAKGPTADLLDVRMDNDWVVSRTGWAALDGVVALRSGGPSNHEHADRNSVIFKAHGERLFHDPFRAAYSPKDARWKLRQTDAHTAVLVDSKGHQYHDGREGVNSSWAWARVQSYAKGDGWMTVTSDATEAYALVNEAITLVERTVIYLKPDILLLLDRVELKGPALPVQVRSQVYNDDSLGKATAGEKRFGIQRPHAQLYAWVAAQGETSVRVGQHDLEGVTDVYPYVEVTSAKATSHVILTAAVGSPTGEKASELRIASSGSRWTVQGEHRGRNVAVELVAEPGRLPVVKV